MQRLKVLGLSLIAMFVCGVAMASSASAALPTVLFLSGEAAPVTVSGSVTGATELKASQNLEGKGVSLKLELPSGTSNLGPYTSEFKAVKEKAGNKALCETAGAGTGVVKVTGEGHLVFDTLSPVLGVAVLFLVATVLIDCNAGALDFKVSGSVLGLVTPLNKEVLTSETFKGKLHCAAGTSKQEDLHYFNNAGVEQTSGLTVEVGGTKGNGCEEVAEEVPLTPSKMIELMG